MLSAGGYLMKISTEIQLTSPVAPVPDTYECIESLFECASACWISADAFLHEAPRRDLNECIVQNLKCAEVCAATARLLVQEQAFILPQVSMQLKLCIQHAEACIQQSQMYLDHEHCQICSKCCEQCSRICADLLERLAC
jgi:hypothetical protein